MTAYKIMTLNMLTDVIYSFGDDRFSRRIIGMNEMIRTHHPDLIGVQELTGKMFRYMDEIFNEYELIGENRHSRILNEYSAILYKKDKFDVLENDTYWLSPEPKAKGSRFRLSQFPRIVTYALLKDKETGETFTFFNTHLDQTFNSVRKKQAEVLRGIILDKQKGKFTAVTGDFNALSDSDPLRVLCDAGLKDTAMDSLGSTLRGKIGSAIQRNRPIDHILISEHIEAYKLIKIDQKYDGYWVSDHYPLMIEMEI